MKKTLLLISLFTLSLVMSGCNKSNKIQDTDLMHHRFVLIKSNGQPVSLDEQAELIFGEKMTITGKMCNQFSGQVTLNKDSINGSGLAMTKMLCSDEQLNQLDYIITQLITNGAKINLNNNQLTLKNNENELIYQLNDLM
ncbi:MULTISPECIES: META domain-containing protein [unclassified Gilliamella]|uniref:META domain-containing protein n=1 Tax=unclassified Gilliamella TaxID=2685620 RepID=UPI001325CF9B|nr:MULTISPECIES: META domain-containing protein [unclassified Gilliamella]MWN31085.1 META domain-containing protein [Gilliamella sp. Pra-s60]MWP28350.1 META domain-containing protein [Gilliamella sp. Pra-s54]MWP46044.1 META domain-containing protein [Gilliamella sp. Pas-s27]